MRVAPLATAAVVGFGKALVMAPQRSVGSGLLRSHELRFDHLEVYVDDVRPMEEYRELEGAMDAFSVAMEREGLAGKTWYSEEDVEAAKRLFENLAVNASSKDLIAQLICGLNWRSVGVLEAEGTRSVAVAAPGEGGATFVITASEAAYCREFFKPDRPGVGALAFRCESVDAVRESYRATHPELEARWCGDDVFEAYAYYKGDKPDTSSLVLRFLEGGMPRDSYENPAARFATADHWVSNVLDREGFIRTMEEALGLSRRVEFDAGVIAAGEAVIESTVVGGDSVYLPVNNALSEAGHVAAYLREIGQGVQHVASRVDDLVQFVSTANMLREVTGIGFEFLDIPRTYYGVYRGPEDVAKRLDGIVDRNGLVDLDATRPRVLERLAGLEDSESIADAVLRARYSNVEALLGDRLSEEQYLRLVKSRILVDVQGPDALLQIFTKSILQREEHHEAPFLEFIQRKCPDDKKKPGCGGFGIRNFLALFISIELNAAMQLRAKATDASDRARADAKINCVSAQLAESNPVLDEIADAMALEARHQHDPLLLEAAQQRKAAAQAKLQAVSARYAEEARRIEAASFAPPAIASN